jgi:hypothetical protein
MGAERTLGRDRLLTSITAWGRETPRTVWMKSRKSRGVPLSFLHESWRERLFQLGE